MRPRRRTMRTRGFLSASLSGSSRLSLFTGGNRMNSCAIPDSRRKASMALRATTSLYSSPRSREAAMSA